MSGKKKSYIRFEKVHGLSGDFWVIINRSSGDVLGHIEWYPQWECFVFFSSRNAVWSSDCHDEVGAFLKEAKR